MAYKNKPNESQLFAFIASQIFFTDNKATRSVCAIYMLSISLSIIKVLGTSIQQKAFRLIETWRTKGISKRHMIFFYQIAMKIVPRWKELKRRLNVKCCIWRFMSFQIYINEFRDLLLLPSLPQSDFNFSKSN